MPIEVGIWKLGGNLQRIKTVSLDSESRLEAYSSNRRPALTRPAFALYNGYTRCRKQISTFE